VSFVDVAAGLPGSIWGALAWGDYDNDGDLDLARSGDGTYIFENTGGDSFSAVGAGLPSVANSALAWGDYDNDGDLDLALAGVEWPSGGNISRIYENVGGFVPNTPASAPLDVVAITGGGEVLLCWLPATDMETPQEGLSYNLRIGKTTSDDGDYPSMADEFGFRLIPARGPITENPWFVSAWVTLPPGVYCASVQAIDASMEGGAWSDPVTFVIP